MKTTNDYWMRVFGRKNALKELIFNMAIGLCSAPRLMIEVFFRRNMGCRYFSTWTCIVIIIAMVFMPFGMNSINWFNSESQGIWMTIYTHITWYLFIAAFGYFSFERFCEVDIVSPMDFTHFTLAVGVSILSRKGLSNKTVYTIYEPAIFFVAGLVLCVFHQILGPVLMLVAIIHSLSYFGSYYLSTNAILDKIDQWILSQEFHTAFKDQFSAKQTRGFQVMVDKRPHYPKSFDDIDRLVTMDYGYRVR